MPRTTLRLPARAIAQRALAAYSAQMRERAADVSPAWDAVRRVIFDSTKDRFAKEGRRGGFRKWAALSRPYKDWKEEHFPGNPLLTLTTRMRLQLSGVAGDHYEFRSRTQMRIGSNIPVGNGWDLGGIHAVGRGQVGTSARELAAAERAAASTGDTSLAGQAMRARQVADLRAQRAGHQGAMPARPPFGITVTDTNKIADVLTDYILGTSED